MYSVLIMLYERFTESHTRRNLVLRVDNVEMVFFTWVDVGLLQMSAELASLHKPFS